MLKEELDETKFISFSFGTGFKIIIMKVPIPFILFAVLVCRRHLYMRKSRRVGTSFIGCGRFRGVLAKSEAPAIFARL